MVLDEEIERLKDSIAHRRNKRPIFVLRHDGSVSKRWVSPYDRESRAFDWEQNPGQNVFVEGYANPVQIELEEDDEDNPVGKLIPSERYTEFMQQKIISDAVSGGGLDSQRMFHLGLANLGGIIILIVIVVAMLT
jgi:hypothetical protein